VLDVRLETSCPSRNRGPSFQLSVKNYAGMWQWCRELLSQYDFKSSIGGGYHRGSVTAVTRPSLVSVKMATALDSDAELRCCSLDVEGCDGRVFFKRGGGFDGSN
jgi:hypothetical protein